MKLTTRPPWLIADLGAPHRVLSWSLTHPGYTTARRIAFRQVRDADLTEDLDVAAWLADQTRAAGLDDAPVLLTSRRLSAYELRRAEVEEVRATCLATVGLSNGERVGTRRPLPDPIQNTSFGTINIAVQVDTPLSDAALLESLSITVQARTAAVMDHGPDVLGGRITGTGTDCVAVVAPSSGSDAGAPFAGLHTACGEAVGRAVYDAVAAGVRVWMAQQRG